MKNNELRIEKVKLKYYVKIDLNLHEPQWKPHEQNYVQIRSFTHFVSQNDRSNAFIKEYTLNFSLTH